jgi:hypothetical protein
MPILKQRMNVQLICGMEKDEFEIKILIQESTLGQ